MSSSDQMQQLVDTVAGALSGGNGKTGGERPRFSLNRLATPPLAPRKRWFGLFSVIEVPPGTWGVYVGQDGAPAALRPGSHWLDFTRGPVSAYQLVDAARRRHELPPVSGLTADGWRVTLQAALVYEVANPALAARMTDAISTLEASGRAAILAQIEALTHEALIGSIWTAGGKKDATRPAVGPNQAGALRQLELGILARLRERPSLAGIEMLEVAIIKREGDERLVEIVRSAEIERTQVVEEQQTEGQRAQLARMRLESEAQAAAAARAAALIAAETQVQLAAVAEQMRLQTAQMEAEILEIQQAQQAREEERKRLAEEWRTAKQLDFKVMEYQHEETLAVIQGTAQVTAEAARAGLLESVEGSMWPRPANDRVVGEGIQVLKGFREQIAPPVTRFLPQPVHPLGLAGGQDRVRAEALRLERIPGAEHELVVRQGQLSTVRIWFNGPGPAGLADVELEFSCPESYPLAAPLLAISRAGNAPAQQSSLAARNWEPELYLADLVRELMVELLSEAADRAANSRREERKADDE